MNELQKDIVLLAAHFVNEVVTERANRLKAQLDKEKYDVALLLNTDMPPKEVACPAYAYDNIRLSELGYTPICNTVLPGSCHFPLLAFYLDNPRYRRYWFVEYDVIYSGNWSDFMSKFEDDRSDFLSCEIERYDPGKNGHWPWWAMGNNCGYPINKCVRGFNPICRYSKEALEYIDMYQRKGYSAHSEVLITTALHNAGFRVSDFCGEGEFSQSCIHEACYIRNDIGNLGTVRWRPAFGCDERLIPGMLYHPVKTLHNIEKSSMKEKNIIYDIDGRSTTPSGADQLSAEETV